MSKSKIQIRPDERVLLVGKTGSGKTYLARRALRNVKRLIIIDSKNSLGEWVPDLPLKDRIKRELGIYRPPKERIRFVPPVIGQEDLRLWYDRLFNEIYAEGDCYLYIDEIYAIVPPGADPPPGLTSLYTRGRERGVSIWSATQRPVWVPLFTLSESEHFFCFQLHLKEDRSRMAGFMGANALRSPPDQHGFWYYYTGGDQEEASYIEDANLIFNRG